LKLYLESCGLTVRSYANPRDFLEKECRNGCDKCRNIIVSDVNMPGMDGVEFSRQLIEQGYPQCNIALMYAAWEKRQIKQISAQGVCVFHKPVCLDVLYNWIERQKTNCACRADQYN
jgi:CheY-like chemotaxis protein